MKNDETSKRGLGLFVIAWGIFLILEGLQITQFGKPANDTPYWMVSLAGTAVVLVGIMMFVQNLGSRWKDLLAFFITGAMGSMGLWISLFAEESSISGNLTFLSQVINIPVGRTVFGIGAMICYLMSFYALKLFRQKSLK